MPGNVLSIPSILILRKSKEVLLTVAFISLNLVGAYMACLASIL